MRGVTSARNQCGIKLKTPPDTTYDNNDNIEKCDWVLTDISRIIKANNCTLIVTFIVCPIWASAGNSQPDIKQYKFQIKQYKLQIKQYKFQKFNAGFVITCIGRLLPLKYVKVETLRTDPYVWIYVPGNTCNEDWTTLWEIPCKCQFLRYHNFINTKNCIMIKVKFLIKRFP